MSKTYRCRIRKDIRRTVRTHDEAEYEISLLDLLPDREMEEEYKKTLRDAGAVEKADGGLAVRVGDIEITIHVEKKTAKARIEGETEVSVKVDRVVEITEWTDNEERANRKADQQVTHESEREIQGKEEEEKRRIEKKLEEADEKIKEKLRELANETYKKALRKKAHRLGKVIVDQESRDVGNDGRLVLEVVLE